MDTIHVSPLPLQDHPGGSVPLVNRCLRGTSAGNILYTIIIYCILNIYGTMCILYMVCATYYIHFAYDMLYTTRILLMYANTILRYLLYTVYCVCYILCLLCKPYTVCILYILYPS